MLPLDSLLHRLESAGFKISPADRLRVVQLLDTVGGECLENPKKLRQLLAPILCRSAAEQNKFYEVFDQWIPRQPSNDDSKFLDLYTKRSRNYWIIATLLVVFTLVTAWHFTHPGPAPTLPKQETNQDLALDSIANSEKNSEFTQEKPVKQEILKPLLPIKELLLAKEQETPRPNWLAWVILGLLVLVSTWLWWKWANRAVLKSANPDQLSKYGLESTALAQVVDAPPYAIPFKGQETYIRTGREQYRLADAMRQRQQGEHPYMDVSASVQATLEKGGFPTLYFRLRRQPADYLCIIDEKHRQSHLTRLFRFFVEHIRGQDVALEIFQASSTMGRFWNAQYPTGLTLDHLQRLYPAHRLLLLGDAHPLLDLSASGQARVRPEMSVAFRRWRQRILLTPNAPSTWTFEEKALYDLFMIFPASLKGMNDAAHHIEASVGVSVDDEAPPSFARWRERAQQGGHDSHDHRYTYWRDAADHEAYLAERPDLLLWLQSLAVYPSPTWEITLAIGQGLEKQGITVSPDDLLVLSRIDWLQTGRMSSSLREEFLAGLPSGAEMAARKACLQALEAARDEAGNGFAGIELGVNVAIQEFALAPDDPEKQEIMRLLFEAGRVNKIQEQVADGALARHLQRSNSKTNMVLRTLEISKSVRDFVQKEDEEKPKTELLKKTFFTSYFWSASMITILTLVFAFLAFMFALYPSSWHSPEGGKSVWLEKNLLLNWEILPDSATIWNNRGVLAWNERQDTLEAIYWFNKAERVGHDNSDSLIFEGGVLYAPIAVKVNLERLHYNIVAKWLNVQFDQLPIPPDDRLYQESPDKYFRPRYLLAEMDSAIFKLKPLTVSRIDPLRNDALHALGLTYLYCFQRDSAMACYERLISRDSLYFTELKSLSPTLESLLGKESDRILRVETSVDLRGRFLTKVNYQLKTQPDTSVNLIAELLDANGVVVSKVNKTQKNASKGFNALSFILPSNIEASPFVAKSLRISIKTAGTESGLLLSLEKEIQFEWSGNIKSPDIGQNMNGLITLYFDFNSPRRIQASDPQLADVIDPFLIKMRSDLIKNPQSSKYQDTVLIDYQKNFVGFMRSKDNYMTYFSEGLTGTNKQVMLDSVDYFFEKNVRMNWDSFFSLSDQLDLMLQTGDTLIIKLTADALYDANGILDQSIANRRIASIFNHFMIFDGGAFKKYRVGVGNGQLRFFREVNRQSRKKAILPPIMNLSQNKVDIYIYRVRNKDE